MTTDIISYYSADQAVDDGVLVDVVKHRWQTLTGGLPLRATAHVFQSISLAGILEIWNEYVTKATTPEEKELFSTGMNGQEVWVTRDSSGFTVMFPEDY